MTEFLKLAHLVDQHRVPDMQVRRRRVETCLNNQWLALLELGRQPTVRQHLVAAAHEFVELFLCTCHDFPSGV